MQYYDGDKKIFKKIITLIKQNINFRLTDLEYLNLETTSKLENLQKLSKKNIRNIILNNHDNILQTVSSKGPERLFSFIFFLNGFNIFTGSKFKWYDDLIITNPFYFHILSAIFIINAQIFSDANHRSAAYYLEINHFEQENINKIINNIKQLRSVIKVDYSNSITDLASGIFSFIHYIENIHLMYMEYFTEFI